MHQTNTIAVIGAGIAGLTFALAMARKGVEVTVFERAPQLQEVGAGLQLSPNASRILQNLGVLDHVLQQSVAPLNITIRRANNLKLLSTVPLGAFALERWEAPYLTVHRADLQKALLAKVRTFPSISLISGAAVEDISLTSNGCLLRIVRENGEQEIPFNIVIGADGVWSSARAKLGGTAESRYTGHIAWRAVLNDGGKIVPRDRVTTFVSRNFHLVSYPVRTGKEINLVAITPAPPEAASWTNDAGPARLETAMAGSDPALLRLIRHPSAWTTWPIHEVPSTSPWTFGGRAVLIGDAAHALSPHAAQGAAMAIEDAIVLAEKLTAGDDASTALSSYEAIRRPRLRRVARRGEFNRFAWHAAGPVAIARDMVLSIRKPHQLAADLDWLYGYDARVGS